METPPFDETSLLEQGDDTGEHVGVPLPCIDADHLFQIISGPGLDYAATPAHACTWYRILPLNVTRFPYPQNG